MDSEDDMHDANDVDSLDEDYYSNDTGMDSDNDDDDDAGYEFDNDSDDSFDNSNNHQQKNYTVLKEEDIRQHQEDDITRISTVLSVSRDSACMLLRRYSWNINNVHEEWFADEERVRKAVGLLEMPVVKSRNARELACGICFDSYPCDDIKTAACGHPFCSTCWTAYVSTSINDGPGCLTLKCPSPSCGAAIGIDMVNMLSSDEDKEKYHRYLLRSYIEDNKKTKWCPAPGCECAVEYDAGSGGYDVSCLCSYSFCWNCTEEAHRPVDCDTVAKWILKNSAESENMNWILANSKPCPKCKRPIEKNQGCMHMTCTPPCKFEFCWLCCGAWSDHGERTGGFYACNRYEAAKQEGAYDEAERRREMAKNSLERYTHYYERWATNQSSRQKALADLQQMQTVHLGKLSEKQCQPETQLKFIIEAWLQIVECRRVLKWTYAYGYYLPEQEQAKRQFFEYLQGEAEAGLERLHQCAEKELQTFLVDSAQEDFNNFRTKLAGLTRLGWRQCDVQYKQMLHPRHKSFLHNVVNRLQHSLIIKSLQDQLPGELLVTRNYFENLVRALENGLSDVDSQVVSSKSASSRNAAGTSKGKGGKGKASARSGGSSKNLDDSGHWSCDQCTFLNSSSSTSCQMCTTRR